MNFNNNLKNNFFDNSLLGKFNICKFNEIINSKILLKNIDLSSFMYSNYNCDKDIFYNLIKILIVFSKEILKDIINKTESNIILYIDYNNNKDDISKGQISYLLEKIINFIYEHSKEFKFINDKTFIITSPKFFLKNDEYLKCIQSIQNNYLDELKYNIDLVIDFNDIKISNYYTNIPCILEDIKVKKYFLQSNLTNEIYKNTALGGSFDHMHLGHNIFLTKACLVTEQKLRIGITSDDMISKKSNKLLLSSYDIRKKKVINFLETMLFKKDIEIYEINSTEGGSADKYIEALILTKETLKGGEIVNKHREKNGLKPLIFCYADIIGKFETIDKKIDRNTINPSDKESLLNTNNKSICDKDNKILRNENIDFNYKISSSNIRENLLLYTTIDVLDNIYNILQNCLKQIDKDIPDTAIHTIYSELRDLYSQSWRRYHNLNHVNDFLNKFYYCLRSKDLKDNLDEISTNLAILYHDVIYTPSRNDNEERSIKYFLELSNYLELNNYNKTKILNIEKVTKLIDATKYHFDKNFICKDFNTNIFMDIDVSSMATEEYEINGENIMYEYSHHLDIKDLYNSRIRFLEYTLDKNVFKTPVFDHLEKKAKENNKIIIEKCKQNLNYIINK